MLCFFMSCTEPPEESLNSIESSLSVSVEQLPLLSREEPQFEDMEWHRRMAIRRLMALEEPHISPWVLHILCVLAHGLE